ncbi:Receptor-like protein 3 [Sesamum angolense]|uniref:Receptor-like protein 3 n=1 Tax=Sesamum angolense TaxID=2727404 RepID=A0AAE1XBQ9_9LAMI|nr:Receptor-like protein 3 [Sesamum angolense]
MLTLIFLFLLLFSSSKVLCCNQIERDSLLSFYHQIYQWSSTDCCRWEGVACESYGSRPPESSGSFLPVSIRILDLSSNRFNGSVDLSILRRAKNLISFNVSNNSFSGPVPSSICRSSPFLQVLDFSMNQFTGGIVDGFGECSNLQIFRAGFNSLSGWLPNDVYRVRTLKEISLSNNHFSGPINGSIVLLSGLRVLELHVNELSGGLPTDIGLLSNLEQLQLHTNSLNGSLPPSLMACTNLTTLLLRNNRFGGEISSLDFSKLQRLQAIDLGNNSFVGKVPDSLCLCRSVTAVRLAYNALVGEIPPCMASLKLLTHLSVSDNYLSNVVGALRTLRNCDNLAVLFMSRPNPFLDCKIEEHQSLEPLLQQISGPIPNLGRRCTLFVLNLTKNFLSGDLSPEICRLPALIADNASTDLSYLALPFLFDSLQYNRLFNLPRGLKVGNNSLTGNIPEELGRLELLHVLDLSNNNFNGSIPDKLSRLINLEKLDMSGNHLSGEIPHYQGFISYLRSAWHITILKEKFRVGVSLIHSLQLHLRGIPNFVAVC